MTAFLRLLAVGLAALTLAGSAEAARIPSGVSWIGIRSATGVAATVREPQAVAKIVTWFEALPRFQALPCPLEVTKPPNVTFTFRGADDAPLLRAVDHAPGTCGALVTYNSTERADARFVSRVSSLLGADFGAAARTVANARTARGDVTHLLGLVALPPGSHRVVSRRNAEPQNTVWPPILASWNATRVWDVRLSLRRVFSFETAHRPIGSVQRESVPHRVRGVVISRYVQLSFPRLAGISFRELDLLMWRLKPGVTRIRARVQDNWVVVRPRSELVPAGVRQIDVDGHRDTKKSDVAKVVRWFNALPMVPPGSVSGCVTPTGPTETLDFRNAAGKVVVRARSTVCFEIVVRIGRLAERPLMDRGFFARVARLLGEKLR